MQIAIMLGGPERGEFFEKAQPWLSEQTVGEIVELSQAMRIPASPVNDGATVLDCPQYLERGFFVDAGGEGLGVPQARRPVPVVEDPGAAAAACTSSGFSASDATSSSGSMVRGLIRRSRSRT